MVHHRNIFAAQLFDDIAERYDQPAQILSFLQYRKWRRTLVSTLALKDGDQALDLCTGTAGVALEMVRRARCQVVGVDLSRKMLSSAQNHVADAGGADQVQLVAGRAEDLPFGDARFDAVCFTYLFRYVDEPERTLQEMLRALKPGGRIASLEFGVPSNPILKAMWHAYAKLILPAASACISPGWRRAGCFLGPSISRFNATYPPQTLVQMWKDLGIADVQVRRLTFGGGVVMWGTKDNGRKDR